MSLVATARGGRTAPARLARGSAQQEAFWGELAGGDTHVVLEARAGTGKSTSCREGIWRALGADPSARCSYVAFNRAIADEFAAGLPPGATAQTMHGAGYAAIRAAVPGVGEPAKHKMYDIVDGLASFRPRSTARQRKAAAVKLAGLCKAHLVGTDVRSLRYGIDPAILDRLCAAHAIEVGSARHAIFDLVPRILARSIELAHVVDFTDMPWLPVVLGLDFPAVDLLFVDEAQDLDPCQHALVRRMAGGGRLVVVGDPYQAIYAFRGADSDSLATLSEQLRADRRGLTTLPLTMTRRCPKSHVELARGIVRDFEALPEAPEGEWSEDADADACLAVGTMTLCRTNAPLVSAAFRLVGRGVPVAIQGRDLGDGLARFVEAFNEPTLKVLLRKVEQYRAAELERLSRLENSEGEADAVADRCDCVLAISEGCGTAAEVAVRIRSLFRDVAPAGMDQVALLSSVHRAKGREAATVNVLRPDSMPHPMARTDEARRQELNLIYVAATRSKDDLRFCGPRPGPLAAARPDAPAFPAAPGPPAALSPAELKRISYFKLNVDGVNR